MKKLLSLLTCLALTGCNQTMTMVHTEGVADDVVDETSHASPTVTPTITPTINIPGVSKPKI